MILLCEQWLTLPLNHNPNPNPEQCQRFKVSFSQQVIVLVLRENVFSFEYLHVAQWTFWMLFLRALVVGVLFVFEAGFGVFFCFPGNMLRDIVRSMLALNCAKFCRRLATL
jgi:hypothetical protein